MKKAVLWTLWAAIPIAAIAFHLGPGQKLGQNDDAASHIAAAQRAFNEENWQGALDEYAKARAALPDTAAKERDALDLAEANTKLEAGDFFDADTGPWLLHLSAAEGPAVRLPLMPAIEFSHVSKEFAHGERQLLMRMVASRLLGLKEGPRANAFQALRDISFTVEQGEALGLIGSNGAGKSTLLALASGVTSPDAGTVAVNGTVAPLLDLGAGFHPDLTGEENLRLNASLLGLTRARTEQIAPAVIEFAALGEFIFDPVRVYSSGMVMRLAFSIAVHLDPDVFVIDEIIAVGDAAFQEKCRLKMLEFRQRRKTLLVASHSPALITAMCDRALWLEKGAIVRAGPAAEVMAAYSNQQGF